MNLPVPSSQAIWIGNLGATKEPDINVSCEGVDVGDGFRQSWMSFDGFTCNEPSRGLAEEWPNF